MGQVAEVQDTWLWGGQPGFDPRCQGCEYFSSLLHVQTGPGVHSTSYRQLKLSDMPYEVDDSRLKTNIFYCS